MKCTNCGYEINENISFCPHCGKPMAREQNSEQYAQPWSPPYPSHAEPISANPVAEHILQMLKDNLFLILCITISVSCGISVIGRKYPVFDIIITIFLWLVFAQSRKGIADKKYMRYVSGAIYASYVITWVAMCILAAIGLILALLFTAINASGSWDAFLSEMELYAGNYTWILNSVTTFSLIFITALFIVTALIGIIINIFGTRSIHKFARSMYKSVEQGQWNLVKCDAAKVWLMVFGVFYAISAVSFLARGNTGSFLEGGCKAVTSILGSILIGKYFGNNK